MRSGRELLDESRAFIAEDTARSWRELLITMTVIGIFAALTLLRLDVAGWWAVRILASVGMGLTLVRMFILYHDHQHGAILRKSKPADLIMTAFGIYILNPSSIWKRSHNYHHKHNAKITGASIGSYPILTVDQYKKATPGQRRGYALTRHPLTIAAGYITIFMIGMCLKSFLTDAKRHRDSLFALLLQPVLIVGFAFIGWDALVLTHLLPMTLACASGAYLFYAQHNFPDIELHERRDWDYVDAALNSSSYMEMGPVMHWFTGNIGYHHVHHLNARIPFYRLKEAMAGIPELQNPGRTSWKLRDIRACFGCKLWDPELKKMVGFDKA